VVAANFAHTIQHGAIKAKTQETTTTYYNLGVIISVSYCVKSKQGTQLCQWATQRLKDYLVGYALNEKHLKEIKDKYFDLQQAIKLVANAGNLFANEKDQSFKSSLETIYQTFDRIDLYLTFEEKAANLLYFIVKNHSFSDGNKRIAAGLFVYFLAMNKRLLNEQGNKRIGDNALVAITIMIAESKSEEKDMMVKLVVNLINNKN